VARERGGEFAEVARERGGELADTARTQVRQRRSRGHR
jgi:hypothetical protein